MGNNELCAIANAGRIELLPYETLRAMFPSVRYILTGESWHRTGWSVVADDDTGEDKVIQRGQWEESRGIYRDPTTARICGVAKYGKGRFSVRAFVPELHPGTRAQYGL